MSSTKSILIIDDEKDLCLLLKDYFTRKNYNVILSHTLQDGAQALTTATPDILFLDNNLPDGIGWDLAPAFAAKHPSSYIVLASAFHPDIPDMPANSRFKVLEKPISILDLDQQIEAI